MFDKPESLNSKPTATGEPNSVANSSVAGESGTAQLGATQCDTAHRGPGVNSQPVSCSAAHCSDGTPNSTGPAASLWQILLIFLRLGCTSFGGPVAHLAFFQTEFVEKRRWLSASAYADLVALCQFLPGPASSQVGMTLGWQQAGWRGALMAWIGFTLPSALLLMAAAIGLLHGAVLNAGAQLGLLLVTMAVVAQALWSMQRSLCKGWRERGLALVVAGCLLFTGGGLLWQLLLMLSVPIRLLQPLSVQRHNCRAQRRR